jgi:nucleoside 2-deoxyribosyltransferase
MLTVYLAGPEVFLPDAAEIGRRKQELCVAYGFEGLYPLDNKIAPAGGARVDQAIYRANLDLIRRADIGICNLTPFRGPSADAGTVYELGLMVGLGKPVYGYTNVMDDYIARVRAGQELVADKGDWRDAAGLLVEDFGNADNLMIDCALVAHGGYAMFRTPATDLYRDLTGFEACLRRAVQSRPRVSV